MERRRGEDQSARIERTLELIERSLGEMQRDVHSLARRVEIVECNQTRQRSYSRTTGIVVRGV